MGLVQRTSNRNQGRQPKPQQGVTWIHLSRLGVAASGMAASGLANISIGGASTSFMRPGPMGLQSYTDNTGRAAKISITGVGMLRQTTAPVNAAATFTMMKRESIIMSTPTLDENGRPE